MHNTDFEIQLAKTASYEELKKYFDRTFLCEEAQVALVYRKQNDLLKEYLSRYILGKQAQIALAKTKNKEILLLCAAKTKLCVEAVKILISYLP